MKNNIFILILTFLCWTSLGQSVPNTDNFTLQDVVNAVNPTTDDLVDCFADAIASYFDPTYEGSKDRLSNFRNYGPHNATTVPSFGAAGTLATDATGNSVTVNYPSGVTSGDFLVMVVSKGYMASTDSYNTPSGWTKIQNTESSQDLCSAVFVKTAGGSEPSTVAVSTVSAISPSSPLVGAMYRYSDVTGYTSSINSVGNYLSFGEGDLETASDELIVKINILTKDDTPTIGGTMDIDSNQSNSSNLGARLIARSEHNTTLNSISWSWSISPSSMYGTHLTLSLTN